MLILILLLHQTSKDYSNRDIDNNSISSEFVLSCLVLHHRINFSFLLIFLFPSILLPSIYHIYFIIFQGLSSLQSDISSPDKKRMRRAGNATSLLLLLLLFHGEILN